ncbi:MAG: MotA/TolQ/ExbB proton channel family protein [Methylococcaceae bacterium]|nr:MotA/TolQ/ExbB proton channel family protein [Methylococcaceae bacterium]
MQAEFLDTLGFISQGGAVSIGVAAILSIMSIGSWTIMVIKAIQARRLHRCSARFLGHFWNDLSASARGPDEPSVCPASFYDRKETDSTHEELLNPLRSSMATASGGVLIKADNPFARIAMQGFNAAGHPGFYARRSHRDLRGSDELIANALRRGIDQEAIQLEIGLTLLASVGSLSPFVGLFGTVCGIYHALGGIAAGGQTTVDKVAGPVGEALIMTAFGLAVALPAVLAYNSLLRDNRLLMAKIESFAHDLHSYLTTGIPLLNLEKIKTLSGENTVEVLSS